MDGSQALFSKNWLLFLLFQCKSTQTPFVYWVKRRKYFFSNIAFPPKQVLSHNTPERLFSDESFSEHIITTS